MSSPTSEAFHGFLVKHLKASADLQGLCSSSPTQLSGQPSPPHHHFQELPAPDQSDSMLTCQSSVLTCSIFLSICSSNPTSQDFPAGAVDKHPPANAGGVDLILGLGKSQCQRATNPLCHNYWACTLEPVFCNKRCSHNDRLTYWKEEWSPPAAIRKSPHTARRPSATMYKKRKQRLKNKNQTKKSHPQVSRPCPLSPRWRLSVNSYDPERTAESRRESWGKDKWVHTNERVCACPLG